jgi:hypothetical protein
LSALASIIPAYEAALVNPAVLPELQRMIAGAPRQCSDIIPNPGRVLQAKQELTDKLRETRSMLR